MTRFLTPHIAQLPDSVPFTGPEALERRSGIHFHARLGANELGFGPSPNVIETLCARASEAWMYADPEAFDLREALASHHLCRPENIVIGTGIDGLLGLLCRLTLGPGQKVVTSHGAYPTFNYHVTNVGAEIVTVPYLDDYEHPRALIEAAIRHEARLVYLANPDNPMGSWHHGKVIEQMLLDLPADCLLVLDEAYSELAPAEAIPTIAIEHPQVIRMRTFSKAYGLAGLRVGYALTNTALAKSFDKIREHFGMSRLSLAAALTALHDQDYVETVRAEVVRARARIEDIAAENGLIALPSATNFVTVDCGADGDFARLVLAECLKRGLFIRMPVVAPLDRCIRISLGPKAEMDFVAEVLPEALKAARAQASSAPL